MNCTRIEDLTADYLGDELDADQRRTFDAHLEVCETCRGRITEMQQTLAALNRLSTVSPATAVEGTRSIHLVSPRSLRRSFAGSMMKAAAVLALGIFLGRASVGDGGDAIESQPASPPQQAAESLAVHPQWIELGRRLAPGDSSLAANLLILSHAGH